MDGDDSDREQRLLNRARALTDITAHRRRFYSLCIELLSRPVPEGGLDPINKVRRHVIVHRDLRAATRRSILSNGWDYAVTRVPPGSKSDEFKVLSGWSWHQPIQPLLLRNPDLIDSFADELRAFKSTTRDVVTLKGKHDFKGQDARRATLTGARLNDEVLNLAVPPDASPKPWGRPAFGLEPSGASWRPVDIELPEFADQSWNPTETHGEHHK